MSDEFRKQFKKEIEDGFMKALATNWSYSTAISENPWIKTSHANPNPYIPTKVIFQDGRGVTIVFWSDGTKTVVRCFANEDFVPEYGLAMATMKKIYGERNKYLKIVDNGDHQEVEKDKEKWGWE